MQNAAQEILTGSPDHTGDSQGLVQLLAANLTRELIDIFSTSSSTSTPKWLFQTCKGSTHAEGRTRAEQDSSSILPSFTTNSVLKTLMLVHSLDISQPVTDAVDTTNIPVLWRTHPGSSFQLNPILPKFMHRHRNWLPGGKLMWKILKKIGRNIPFLSLSRYNNSTICWRCAWIPIEPIQHGSSLWPGHGRRLSSCSYHYLGTMEIGEWDNLVTGWSEWESSDCFESEWRHCILGNGRTSNWN